MFKSKLDLVNGLLPDEKKIYDNISVRQYDHKLCQDMTVTLYKDAVQKKTFNIPTLNTVGVCNDMYLNYVASKILYTEQLYTERSLDHILNGYKTNSNKIALKKYHTEFHFALKPYVSWHTMFQTWKTKILDDFKQFRGK